MQIRLVSYNIQHARDHIRSIKEDKDIIDFDLTAKAIKSQNPDIVVMNEVRNEGNHPTYKDQTKIIAEKTGFNYYKFGEAIRFEPGLPYGNAILSKYPITEFEIIKIPDPEVKDEDIYYETRCVIKAVVNIQGKKITVFGSHFGLAQSEQRNAVETVIKLLGQCDMPHVLMGDFNMDPDDEKLKPIYDRLTDTAKYFDKPKLSFPSNNPEHKIDYIFVSDEFKVIFADIPDIVVSDHRMVVCDVEI
ncbi:MAG: endonuclease/exonuclease/phosphatase family protein [Caldicoprobacterales bacterium]